MVVVVVVVMVVVLLLSDDCRGLCHLLSSLPQDEDTCVSCTAMASVLSLFFHRPPAPHVAIVAEMLIDGGLFYPTGRFDVHEETLLLLAKANGITVLLTTPREAELLTRSQQRAPQRLAGVEVRATRRMVEVVQAFFS